MTGPEHYAEAERLLDDSGGTDEATAMWKVAKAQVHATLALSAAQSYSDTIGLCDHGNFPCARCLHELAAYEIARQS